MQQGANPEAILGLALGMFCFIAGVVLAITLVIAIFYLLTLQKALSRVSPRNRLMEPGMVWLMLIPCVNIIWQFMIAINVPGSLRNEFRDRGRDDGSDYGKSIALTNCILGLVSGTISNVVSRMPNLERAGLVISLIGSVAGIVLFIVFWVKIANYSSQLAVDDDYRQRDIDRKLDQFNDDDDDRGAPPGAPPGDSPKPSPDTYKEGDPGRYQ
jgi:hypothetical protein